MMPADLFSSKTMESLLDGVATHFQASVLFLMRTESLASSQSRRSIDADAQYKWTLMVHVHQSRRTWIQIQIWIPNPIVTLFYAELFPLARIWIRIPARIVSQMVTVSI